jgi:hypothetical protein
MIKQTNTNFILSISEISSNFLSLLSVSFQIQQSKVSANTANTQINIDDSPTNNSYMNNHRHVNVNQQQSPNNYITNQYPSHNHQPIMLPDPDANKSCCSFGNKNAV